MSESSGNVKNAQDHGLPAALVGGSWAGRMTRGFGGNGHSSPQFQYRRYWKILKCGIVSTGASADEEFGT